MKEMNLIKKSQEKSPRFFNGFFCEVGCFLLWDMWILAFMDRGFKSMQATKTVESIDVGSLR